MRNLKRALSLAVASVMLLGLMVVGTGAASVGDFNDADQISNVEAAAVTTGLGIFVGADGNFMPDQPVTRAEMATIIIKILYGNDYNADSFKGIDRFDDVASYQGGWAEGYINLCSSLGIVGGYAGTNNFGPGDTVTTAQACLMLMKALGYYDEQSTLNEYGDNWELAAMTRADQLGLRGDVVMQTNQALTRDNVSLLVFNTLFAQRVSYNVDRNVYVKANDFSVAVNNGTQDETNTLAHNTFGLYTVDGVVVANSYTDKSLMADDQAPAQTLISFEDEDEAVSVERNRLVDDGSFFEDESGLDLIGHRVTVYYSLNSKGVDKTFVMVDQATLTGAIYAGSSADMAKDANALGFRRDTVMNVIENNEAILNYDMDVTVKASDIGGDKDPYENSKLLLVSNSSNRTVDYVIVLDQLLDKVASVEEFRNRVDYEMEVYDNSTDFVVTDEVAVDDYVILTNIGNQDDLVVVEPATLVSASITRLVGRTTDSAELKSVVADGDTYTESPVAVANNLSDTTAFQSIEILGETTLVLDEDGLLVALSEAPVEDIGYAYVAQFGTKHTTDSFTKERLAALIYYANGESEVRIVDQSKSAAGVNGIDITKSSDLSAANAVNTSGANKGIPTAGSLIGVYYVVENRDGSVQLQDVQSLGDGVDTVYRADYTSSFSDLEIIKNHALLMDKHDVEINFNTFSLGTNDRGYANSDSVFFYVNGVYGDENDPLEVIPKVGIGNAVNFVNGDKNDDNETITIGEGWMEMWKAKRNTLKAMSVYNVDLVSNDAVYYFNQNDYAITYVGTDNYAVEFYVHDKNGEPVTLTYDGFNTVDRARSFAKDHESGFYKEGANDMSEVFTANDGIESTSGSTRYVVEGIAVLEEVNDNDSRYEYNLFVKNGTTTYTTGVYFDGAKVIDLVNDEDEALNTVGKLINAVKNGDSVKVSYSYKTSNYTPDVIYITEFNGADVTGPGQGQDGNIINVQLASDGNVRIDVSANTTRNVSYEVTLWRFTDRGWTEVESQEVTVPSGTTSSGNLNNWLTGGNISGSGFTRFALQSGVTYRVTMGGQTSASIVP